MSEQPGAEPIPAIQHLSIEQENAVDKSSPSATESTGYDTPLTVASEPPAKDDATKNVQPAQDDMPQGPIKTPISHPLPECQPQVRPALTAEQDAKFSALLDTVSGWTQVPDTSARASSSSPITEAERMWLTRECLLRYLRASSWSPIEAPKRLLATLTWRREYGVLDHTPEYISIENETGKQQILGYDNAGRPCLYMNPAQQNTKRTERQLHHLVFMLDRVIDLMPVGQETMALLINFRNTGQAANPSIGQGKQTLNILQNHYPERLGRALISELPWYMTTFFKLISPFIDPVTKEKMVFNDDLRKHVPPVQLDKQYGGDAEFVYDHDVYWPALNKLCEERRNAYRERWERAGSRVGEYEAYLRGGEQESLRQTEDASKGSTEETV